MKIETVATTNFVEAAGVHGVGFKVRVLLYLTGLPKLRPLAFTELVSKCE